MQSVKGKLCHCLQMFCRGRRQTRIPSRTLVCMVVVVILLFIAHNLHQLLRSNIHFVTKVKFERSSRPPRTEASSYHSTVKVLRSYLSPRIDITTRDGVKHELLLNKNRTSQKLISDNYDPNYMTKHSSKHWQEEPRFLQAISCNRLLNNDSMYQDELGLFNQTWFKGHFFKVKWPQKHQCQIFIKRQRYIVDGISQSELDFPMAYNILMYKDPEQVEHLLRAIYRPQNFYCIHIDKKSHLPTKQAMHALASCFGNVFIPENSTSVVWGHYSVLEAELICLDVLLDKVKNITKKWKYFINLTGQEFPLKTNWELVQILRAYNGASEVGVTTNSHWEKRWKCYGKKKGKCITYAIPPQHNYTFGKGDTHVVLNYDLSKFIISDPISKDLIQWLHPLQIIDEIFFQTLFCSPQLNVPSAYTGPLHQYFSPSPTMTRYKKWGHKNCRGRLQRGICLGSIWELPSLVRSPQLFFNKFEIFYHPVAYYCLEEWHNNKVAEERMALEQSLTIHFDVEAYKELPWVKYHL